MSIVLARIDDRLIHGQVTEGWCKKLLPDLIIVVSQEVAVSNWQCDLCLAALPECFKGMVVGIEDAPEIINTHAVDNSSAFVLFENTSDAYHVICGGAKIDALNVGGMHSSKGKREILDYIYIDDDDIAYLKKLQEHGVKLDFRDIPEHESIDVMSRL